MVFRRSFRPSDAWSADHFENSKIRISNFEISSANVVGLLAIHDNKQAKNPHIKHIAY